METYDYKERSTNELEGSLPPHPGPLPWGEGARSPLLVELEIDLFVTAERAFQTWTVSQRRNGAECFSLSQGRGLG